VIDVSQSVESNHPDALGFLRIDCTNVTNFFRRNGVCTMTVKELFTFITDTSITDSNLDEYLDKAMSLSADRTVDDNDDIVYTEVRIAYTHFIVCELVISSKAFSFTAPTVWNNLSLSTRSAVTFDSFKFLLKTELFGIAFPDVPP